MRPIPALLLNVVTVVVALLLYDQFRGDADNSGSSRASSGRAEVGDSIGIEERLRRIESRLAAIPAPEQRVDPPRTGEPDSSAELPAPVRETARTPREAERPTVDTPSTDAPTREEVAHFRRLQEAVRRESSVKANRDRINRQLDKVGINLTPAQREKIHYAWAAFEPRVGVIWTAIKTEAQSTADAGGTIDGKMFREQGIAQIQSEFAASLSEIVNHTADADAVAAALTARGGK
jgi:hypothetical protein